MAAIPRIGQRHGDAEGAPPWPAVSRVLGRDWKIAWVFLLPLLLVLVGLVAYPFVSGIVLSMQEKVVGQAPTWVGLRNYRELLVGEQYSGIFWNSVRVSVIYTGVAVGVKLALGMCMALLLNEKFRGQTLMRAVLFLPWAVPTIIVALTWRWIYDGSPSGLINYVRIEFFEQQTLIQFLADPSLALWCVVWVLVWGGVGFYLVLFNAAMSSIPRDIFEAAALDGATRVVTFARVTVPLLWDTIQTSWVYLAILALDAYALVAVMTAGPGGPDNATQVMALQIAQNGFQFGRAGYASAMGVVLFFLTMLIAAAMLRATRRERIEY